MPRGFKRAAAAATAAAIALLLCAAPAAVTAEDMCGPNNDIPCSLYGCGAPNQQGVAGQLPCKNYYPRDCKFTFKSQLQNYDQNVIDTKIAKLSLPAASAATGTTALHSSITDPLVYTTSGSTLSGCTVSRVEVVSCVQNLKWRNVACTRETEYPDFNAYSAASDSMQRTLSLDEQFVVGGDNSTLAYGLLAPEHAVSLYSAVSGTATVVTMSCSVPEEAAPVESCLLFEAVPKNESPSLYVQNSWTLNVSYVFTDPLVPMLTLSAITDGTASSTDTVINPTNAITDVKGKTPSYCSGDVTEYQGEDGTWHSIFKGTDGHMYSTGHMLYVDGEHLVNAVMQKPWASVYGVFAERNLRLGMECLDYVGDSMNVDPDAKLMNLYFASTNAPASGEWIAKWINCHTSAPAAFCPAGYEAQPTGADGSGSSGAVRTAATAAAVQGPVLLALTAAVAALAGQ